MEISNASEADIAKATRCLASAFETDPLMAFFFPGSAEVTRRLTFEMLAILLSVRIALGMPALLLKQDGQIAGAVMGYDARRPKWPALHAAQWARFEAKRSDMAERFATMEAISGMFKPKAPHFYLGALGVQPGMQGRGGGAALVEAFCRASAEDALSAGTYLETGNPHNLDFYQRCGFDLLGRGELDADTSLWCLFRSSHRAPRERQQIRFD
jgi:GNAT superfamily N-acetyltransferase